MIERSTLDTWLKVSLCYWQLCEGFHVWFEKSFIQFDVRSLLLFSFPVQTLPYHLINDLLVEPGELELKHRTSNRSGNLINLSFIFYVVFHYVPLDSLPMCGPMQFQYVTKIVSHCDLLYVLRTEVLTVDTDVT